MKNNIERLTAKLDNLDAVMAKEVECIFDTGHTSGTYSKDDLQRVYNDVESIMKYVVSHKDKIDKLMFAYIEHKCIVILYVCQEAMRLIEEENEVTGNA